MTGGVEDGDKSELGDGAGEEEGCFDPEDLDCNYFKASEDNLRPDPTDIEVVEVERNQVLAAQTTTMSRPMPQPAESHRGC